VAAVAKGRRVRSERSSPRVCVQTRIPSRNLNNYLIYIWCPVAGRGRKSTNGRPWIIIIIYNTHGSCVCSRVSERGAERVSERDRVGCTWPRWMAVRIRRRQGTWPKIFWLHVWCDRMVKTSVLAHHYLHPAHVSSWGGIRFSNILWTQMIFPLQMTDAP